MLLPPKTLWSLEEDKLLTETVQQYGAKKWNFIATFIPGRTGKQCRERWMAHISPDVRTDEFSDDEIRLLLDLHEKYGNSWSYMSQFFDRRPPNVIKNKFNCILRKTKSIYRAAQVRVNQNHQKNYRRCILIPLRTQTQQSIITPTIMDLNEDLDAVFDTFDVVEFESY